MTLHVQSHQGVTLIRPEVDALDLTTARGFRREVVERVPSQSRTVLDLGGVGFIDSTGCGAILGCFKHFQGDKAGVGGLKICAPSSSVRSLFEMIRLHQVIEIYSTRDEAVRAYAPA